MKNLLILVFNFCFLFCVNSHTTNHLYHRESFSISGIDVSHHQGHIDWNKVISDSINFVFIKSTQGCYFKDHKFKYNSQSASGVGIKVGAYHYYEFGTDPHCQFDNFIKHTPKEILDLPPVLDLEYCSNEKLRNPHNKNKFLSDIKILNKLMTQHYGVEPIFYTAPDFYLNLIKNNFTNKIWICYLEDKEVSFLKPEDWNFRQYSFWGRIKGIPVLVDLDFFKGDLEDFEKMLMSRDTI